MTPDLRWRRDLTHYFSSGMEVAEGFSLDIEDQDCPGVVYHAVVPRGTLKSKVYRLWLFQPDEVHPVVVLYDVDGHPIITMIAKKS